VGGDDHIVQRWVSDIGALSHVVNKFYGVKDVVYANTTEKIGHSRYEKATKLIRHRQWDDYEG
jgi:hypothetical protein